MKLHFFQTTWSNIANPFDVVKEATVTFLVQAAYGFAQEWEQHSADTGVGARTSSKAVAIHNIILTTGRT